MAMVRRYYGVPARRGAEVIYRGLQFPVVGRIISSDGSHLYLRIENGGRFGPLHPTWEMDYGDGRDYGAEMDARIRARNEAWRTQQTGSINAPRL
jgi:hypothetical protein